MDVAPRASVYEIIKVLGRPIQLITHKYAESIKYLECNVKALEDMLYDPLIAPKYVSIIAIIGPARQGKSFLLNFFLKYICAKYKNLWLSNMDQSLDGFSWTAGLKTNTNGICLWSEAFITKFENDERVVLLMDCEGTYDKFNSLNDSTKLAAFSLLLSSQLLLNIPHCLDDEIFDFSESFMNYANLITGSWCSTKPFQNIMAVIRDWCNTSDYPYGLQGGELYLKNIIKLAKNIHYSKTAINEDIFFKHYCKTIFNNIQCCLLPHPGFKAATNSNFDGKLKDISAPFLEHLRLLVSHLFNPENLQLKKINNHYLTCREFVQYFKSLVHIIDIEKFPVIQNILTENGNFNQAELFEDLKIFYITSMDKFISKKSGFIKSSRIDEEHKKLIYIIQMKINNAKQFNKTLTLEDTKAKVKIMLNDFLKNYQTDNNNKNLQMSIFTPFALIVPLPFTYFMFYFAKVFYIAMITVSMEILFYFILTINLLWISCCYYEIEFISAILDIITDIIINYIFKPVISLLKTKPAKLLNPFYAKSSKELLDSVEE